jgi:site-specific recombinase XerD
VAFVAAHPQCSSGALFQELERRHPGRYTPSHRKTLAIGLRKIRACQLETRGEEWPTEVIQAVIPGAVVPGQQENPQDHAQGASSSAVQTEERPPISSGTDGEDPLYQPAVLASTHADARLAPTAERCQEAVAPVSLEKDQKLTICAAAFLSLDQVGRWFLEDQQAYGSSPETLAWYQRGLKQLQEYLTRRHLSLLSEVTETEVRGWLAFLRAEPSATGSLRTANTVLTAARSVHAFCAWAVRQGHLSRMPFVQGMVPWRKNHERDWQHIQVIEPEVFDRLLHACRPSGSKGEREDHATARNRAILWMILESGLLVSEVCALSLGDVDDRFQALRIQGSGAKGRHLPQGTHTQRELREYLDHHRVRMGNQSEHDPLFLSECRRQMTPNLLTQLFNRLSMRADITGKPVTPSMLRETFAVRFLQAGGSMRALQEQLGLEDAVSVKRYQLFCDQLNRE